MTGVLLYLVQVIVASGILYVYYHLFLRNKRFHQYNRFYLLSAVCISVLVPFFNIPVYFSDAETDSSVVLRTWQSISLGYEDPVVLLTGDGKGWLANSFTWASLFYAIYIAASLILLARIGFSLYRIRRIIHSHSVEDLKGVRFVNTTEPGTPFSFFRWLFWHRRIELGSPKGEYIFRHEIFHIRQKHSLDILFLELVTVIFWINPFFHIIRRETKAIHEFLADRFAATEDSKWEYSELLLMQVLNTRQPLVNPFFHNQIKRRIAMITNPQQTSHQYLRKILVLPLAAVIILLFAFRYQSIAAESDVNEKNSGVTEMIDARDMQPLDTTSAFLKLLQNVSITVNEMFVEAPGYTDATRNTVPGMIVVDDIAYPMQEFVDKLKGVSGISVNIMRAIPPGNAAALKKYGSMAANGVIELNGVVLTRGQGDIRRKDNPPIDISGVDRQNPPLIMIDGKIQPREQGMAAIDKLSPDVIETITQLKGQIALDIYGKDAKNGALIIITKKYKAEQAADKGKTDIVVVNGYKLGTKNTDVQQKQHADEVVVTGYQRDARKPDERATGTQSKEVVVVGYQAMSKQTDAQEPVEVVVEGYKREQQKPEEPAVDQQKPVEVVVTGYQKNPDNVTFERVEEEASFPGGVDGWRKFLVQHLDATVGLKNNAPAGTYTIYVQFIVNKEGELSDFKLLSNHGYGMDEEALRVIRLSPKWIPARQNGKVVTSYRKQPISFMVSKEDK